MKRLFSAIVFATVSFCSAAYAQTPTFRLCTGLESGNYYKAGHILRSATHNVEVVQTKGSLDNLERMIGGQCDGAFVQSDSLLVYSARNARAISGIERAGILYKEMAHLLCNRDSNIGRVTDLGKSNTIAVGGEGSGARTTWDAFVLADKKRYEPVQTDGRSGTRALAAIADGSQVQCLLWVGALKGAYMTAEAQEQGSRVVLVGTDDWDMGKVAKDARGAPVYSYEEIPDGTYPKIQPSGTVYGTKSIKVIAVDALFVASTAWINANEAAYDRILRAFNGSAPRIRALVNPN